MGFDSINDHDHSDGSTGGSTISPDDASVANAPTGDDDVLRWQEGAETGTVTADGVDNSTGNDDWGQSTLASTTESFANAFSATPAVAVGLNNDQDSTNSDQYSISVNNKSSTGFDAIFRQMSSNDHSGTTDTYALDYVASEGR